MDKSVPDIGNLVEVRQRRYLVESLRKTRNGLSTVIALACIDDDDQGRKLEVYWENELDRRIIETENWEGIADKGFDPPEKFAAYLNTIRWNCVTATNPKLLQAPFRAGIKIEAYQLEPLRRALQMPRVNLFIADDVGLGKTIEAGLIVRELILRRKVNYVVVAAPPSMILQWQSELDNRFGLSFQIIDNNFIRDLRKERGHSINPWSTHTRFLISQKLLIDEAYVSGLRDFLSGHRMGSILILDEAHHAAPSTGIKYAVDSQLTGAVRELAWLFEHRLFLSATPHNGHSNSFSALLEILDPQRFMRGIPVDPKLRKEIMVRRLKEDLRELVGGLPKREVVQIDIDGVMDVTPEIKLFDLLSQYIEAKELRLKGVQKTVKDASKLVLSNLQQRLLSSIEAFYRTLRKHKKSFELQISTPSENQISININQKLDLLESSVGPDDERADLDEELNEIESDSQMEIATKAGFGPREGTKRESELLNEIEKLAGETRFKPDQKILKIITWMKSNQCHSIDQPNSKNKPWTETRVIIFTEWEDTRRYIHEQLKAAIEDTDDADNRIAVYTGTTSIAKREVIKKRFNTDPTKDPLRILICTDSAREGLNLQKHCSNLFHFDVPWNPSRMEQRNGRIDRKLQEADTVYCHYFFYKERPEDRILEVLIQKSQIIRRELGSMAEVIEDRLAAELKGSVLRRGNINELYEKFKVMQIEESKRKTFKTEFMDGDDRKEEILKNINQLRELLQDSSTWIGYSGEQFKQAIEVGLDIIGAPKLKKKVSSESEMFSIETEVDSLTKKTAWLDSIDQLREPMTNERNISEWRRNAPLRPIVFEDNGSLDGSVVHLHLEHKLSQRLLGRLMTQGFSHHDLSRSCFVSTESNIPKIVLIGRVSLYGTNAVRLHEEIIGVSAHWIDPRTRSSKKLKTEIESDFSKTWESLFRTISKNKKFKLEKLIIEKLHSSIDTDIQDLKSVLMKKAEKYISKAEELLQKRSEIESKQLLKIIENQIQAVKKYQSNLENEPETLQRIIPGLEDFIRKDEQDQLNANKKYWVKRIEELKIEQSTEPEKIKQSYIVRASRFEPVGIVYLWPETN
jgi:hypothetical protein